MIETFARPSWTARHLVAPLTAITIAIGMFVWLSIACLNVTSPPRQQWQAATKPVGPGIDRVLIEGHQATIEGEASTDSQITFAIRGGYESCGFRKNGRFTATVQAAMWRGGLDIVVVDTGGNRLLTAHVDGLGVAQFPKDRIVFGNTPLKPEADGTVRIAEVQCPSGERLPLTVGLSPRPQPLPKARNEASSSHSSRTPLDIPRSKAESRPNTDSTKPVRRQ